MRRIAFFIVLGVFILVIVAFKILTHEPELVNELTFLSDDVADVEYSGWAGAKLVVVHLRDWPFVPRDLCKLHGIDFEENVKVVRKVQPHLRQITHRVLDRYKLRSLYSGGLTEKTTPELHRRIEVVKELEMQAFEGVLDDKGRNFRDELLMEMGTPGQFLHDGFIDKVLPMEGTNALDAARLVPGLNDALFDADTLHARRKAIVAHLPREGVALIVLSGLHDLTSYLPANSLYIRVTPVSYPK